MATCIYSHADCLKHNPGPDPTYAPKRLLSVLKALRDANLANIEWVSAPAATRDQLRLVHTDAFIDQILAPLAPEEHRFFANDTIAVHGTADALRASTGMVINAVEKVLSGQTRNAFCVTSPGGHHAEADAAMGFCFFNHIAIAAAFAQKKLGLQRIAVLDIDTHHGNGTQSLFWNHPDHLFISIHEDNHLSGFAHETGYADNILNLPIPHHATGEAYLKIYQEKVEPKLTAFKPDLLLVSAGFDAHRDDPLGHLALEMQDYKTLGQSLALLADKMCGGKLVAILEGGYNLDYLGDCVTAFVSGLQELS